MLGKGADDVIKVLFLPQHPVNQCFDQAAIDVGQMFDCGPEKEINRVMGGGPEAEQFDGGGARRDLVGGRNHISVKKEPLNQIIEIKETNNARRASCKNALCHARRELQSFSNGLSAPGKTASDLWLLVISSGMALKRLMTARPSGHKR
jgi:hypothetical protein